MSEVLPMNPKTHTSASGHSASPCCWLYQHTWIDKVVSLVRGSLVRGSLLSTFGSESFTTTQVSIMCLDIYKMHDFNTQCVCKVCVKTWQNCYWDLWDVEDRLTTLYLHTPSSKLISVWLMKTVSCTSTSLPITYSALQLFLPKVENEFQRAKDAQSWRYRWY